MFASMGKGVVTEADEAREKDAGDSRGKHLRAFVRISLSVRRKAQGAGTAGALPASTRRPRLKAFAFFRERVDAAAPGIPRSKPTPLCRACRRSRQAPWDFDVMVMEMENMFGDILLRHDGRPDRRHRDGRRRPD